MKRAVMRAVLTLLMLALPVAAQGQMTTQTVVEDGRTLEGSVTLKPYECVILTN